MPPPQDPDDRRPRWNFSTAAFAVAAVAGIVFGGLAAEQQHDFAQLAFMFAILCFYVGVESLRSRSRMKLEKSVDATEQLGPSRAKTQTRLRAAILDSDAKAARNLMVGLGFAGAGLWVLWDTLGATPTDPTQLLAPRVALAIAIEVVGFFFLRLYRHGLEDYKFYHNELTNVGAQEVALSAAEKLSDPTHQHDAMLEVLRRLGGTEPNFILKRGETTVASERELRPAQVSASAGRC